MSLVVSLTLTFLKYEKRLNPYLKAGAVDGNYQREASTLQS